MDTADKQFNEEEWRANKKKNIYIPKLKEASLENFTTDAGIRIRRTISKPARKIIKAGFETQSKLNVFNYPELKDDEAYIFASTHSFPDDVFATLVSFDRHAYFLTNSIDQLDYSKLLYAAWLYGVIIVDPKGGKQNTIAKMNKILENESLISNKKSSILIFPETSWNVTENKTVQKLDIGTSILAHRSGKQVVPIGSYQHPVTKEIYMNYGEPMDLANYSHEEGTTMLRDEMARLRYEMIYKYGEVVKREDVPDTVRMDWLEHQREVVLDFEWVYPDWDDEYLTVKDEKDLQQEEVWSFVDDMDLEEKSEEVFNSKELTNVQKITALKNIQNLKNIKEQRQIDKENYNNYSVPEFLNQTWTPQLQSEIRAELKERKKDKPKILTKNYKANKRKTKAELDEYLQSQECLRNEIHNMARDS